MIRAACTSAALVTALVVGVSAEQGQAGVDLEAAVDAKYGGGCPGCGAVPCVCAPAEKP